jgi:DNA-directed RNA polymerase specialized sigma subunit
MKEYIETLVNSLKSTRQQNLIRLKYFNGHSWLSVAVHMNYSIESVYKIHGKALQELRKIINDYSFLQ